jgi:hypothetical protein
MDSSEPEEVVKFLSDRGIAEDVRTPLPFYSTDPKHAFPQAAHWIY